MTQQVHGPRAGAATASDVVADAIEVHADTFRRFVEGRVPPESVEDVLQTAAVRAIERSGSLDDPERVMAWLYRIHRNVISDSLRRRSSRERLMTQVAFETKVAEEPSPADEGCACSLAQVETLRPAYASILTLVDVGDATLAEAAERLGISVNNATVRLHRARKALRAAMLAHCGATSPFDCRDCRCVSEGCCAA